MGVDEDHPTAVDRVALCREPTEVQLGNGVARKLIDVFVRVIAHVVRTEMNVADIAQQPATGAARQLAQELRLVHSRIAKAEIA